MRDITTMPKQIPKDLADDCIERIVRHIKTTTPRTHPISVKLHRTDTLNGSQSDPIFGLTNRIAMLGRYKIDVAAGKLGTQPMKGLQISEGENGSVSSDLLLRVMETLSHEKRHVSQLQAMRGEQPPRIDGLRDMTLERLAMLSNPGFYNDNYWLLGFELDAMRHGFIGARRYCKMYLSDIIPEADLDKRARDFAYNLKVGINGNVRNVGDLADCLEKRRIDIIANERAEFTFPTLESSENMFSRQLLENKRCRKLLRLWQSNTLTPNERLTIMAGFAWGAIPRLAKSLPVLQDMDWHVRGVDVAAEAQSSNADMHLRAGACAIGDDMPHPAVDTATDASQQSDDTLNQEEDYIDLTDDEPDAADDFDYEP